MLRKLQRKTLVPTQIAGYALTLLVGATIVLATLQLYADLKPLLTQQTDVFRAHTVTVSKNITLLKTADKQSIYFKDKELNKLTEQPFVKSVAHFTSATFNTSAAISFGGQRMSTDLFFESVPDELLDVQSPEWQWDSTSDFLPIVIPEDYLNLYNFGFAESQSLPVVSEAMLSQVAFTVLIEGNGQRRTFQSRIVGLSAKINSILVPDKFLQWANQRYGTVSPNRSSRLLVEFTDASDERIPRYFEANGLNINQTELESSKLATFFRLAMLMVIVVAIVIIALSVAFIILSLNLVVQRNRDLYTNLHLIGYSTRSIARYYRVVISLITAAVMLAATLLAAALRGYYLARLDGLFHIGTTATPLVVAALCLTLLLLLLYNLLVGRIITKCVK